MTTDEAATLLATYQLTGSVSETARQLGIGKATVSRTLKKERIVVAAEPERFRGTKKGPLPEKHDWVEVYSLRETKLLGLVDDKMDAFRPRELIGAVKIIGDARYREEHPESVRGVVIDQSQHVHIDTNAALEALREARKLLPGGSHA